MDKIFVCPHLHECMRKEVKEYLDVIKLPLINDMRNATAVVCLAENFHLYENEWNQDRIVTPQWARRSALCGIGLPLSYFSASPHRLFSGFIFRLNSDKISKALLDILKSLIEHRGGLAIETTSTNCCYDSRLFSHVLFQTSQHPSVCADVGQEMTTTSLSNDYDNNVPTVSVSIEWVLACIDQSCLVDTTPFKIHPSAASASANEANYKISSSIYNSMSYLYMGHKVDSKRTIEVKTQIGERAFEGFTVFISPYISACKYDELVAQLTLMGGTIAMGGVIELSSQLLSRKSGEMRPIVITSVDITCPFFRTATQIIANNSISKHKIVFASPFYIRACVEEEGRRLPLIESTSETTHPFVNAKSILYAPLRCCKQIPSMQSLYISTSGFKRRVAVSQPSRHMLKMLIELTGACFMPHMISGVTTHLICNMPCESEKFTRAIAWGIQKIVVVNIEWLYACIARWEKVDETLFLLRSNDDSDHCPTANGGEGELLAADNRGNVETGAKRQRIDIVSTHESTYGKDCEYARVHEVMFENVSTAPQNVFLLSSTVGANQVRDRLLSLGINVIWPVEQHYDFTCTHLILDEIKRTEKFLCACAAGKWILKPSYIDRCVAEGRLLPENDFEHGIETCSSYTSKTQPLPLSLYSAPKKWRCSSRRPFEGASIAIIGETTPPSVTLRRIIEAGKGKVSIFNNEQVTSGVDIAELAICNIVVMSKENIHLLQIIQRVVTQAKCVLPNFILDFLTESFVECGSSITELCIPSRYILKNE